MAKANKLITLASLPFFTLAGADALDQNFYHFLNPEQCTAATDQTSTVDSPVFGKSEEQKTEIICGPDVEGNAFFTGTLAAFLLFVGQGYSISGVGAAGPGAPTPGQRGPFRRKDEGKGEGSVEDAKIG